MKRNSDPIADINEELQVARDKAQTAFLAYEKAQADVARLTLTRKKLMMKAPGK